MATRGRGRPPAGATDVVSTEQVLDAALDAFGERGYEGTSVREVSRQLGVSHNLIPQRIGSKDDLWVAAVDRGFEQLAVALASALDGLDGADDLDRLRALVVRFIAANAARPALLRIISREAVAPGPRFDHLWERFIDPVRMVGGDLLERLEAEGRVRTGSVAHVYFFMTHGAGGPVALPALAERFGAAVDPSDPAAVDAHAEATAAFLFDGLLK